MYAHLASDRRGRHTGAVRPGLCALAVALSACAPPPPQADRATFSGARSGTVAWSSRAGFWLAENNRALVQRHGVLPSDTMPMDLIVEFGVQGPPVTGSFQHVPTGPACRVTLTDYGARAVWGTPVSIDDDNCRFTFTHVAQVDEVAGPRGVVRSYDVRGSFSATLGAGTNATGTVEISGTF